MPCLIQICNETVYCCRSELMKKVIPQHGTPVEKLEAILTLRHPSLQIGSGHFFNIVFKIKP